MLSATNKRPEPLDNAIILPGWLFWLQLGLTTTVAVLFLVMLVKARQQSAELRTLQDKVAGIENSRALDRTTAIEDQLRSTADRLQAVERLGAQMGSLIADNARLRQQVRLLEGGAAKPGAGAAAEGELPVPPLPPLKPPAAN
jgi:hypothetical protein